ncbi:MAG: gamma-glutamyltransferase [Proteobacteria bacterium]|nr:gamma-glutamyltransferase [Pseudomonadota bacterium]
MKGFMLFLLVSFSKLCFAVEPSQSAVVSSKPSATKAGIQVLAHGGNAFDAANSIASELFFTKSTQPDTGVWLVHDASTAMDYVIEGKMGDLLSYIGQKYGKLAASKSLPPTSNKVTVSSPIVGEYKGMKIVTVPLPAKGGAGVILALDILNEFHLTDLSEADQKHLIAETIRRVNCDIINQDKPSIDLKDIINTDHIHQLRANIKMNRVSVDTRDCHTGNAFKDSLHFSVLDQAGNQVSGILMAQNTPGLDLAAPLFFETQDGKGMLSASGGYRTLAAMLISLLTAKDDTHPQKWVAAPRFMQVSPNLIEFEKDAFTVPLQNALKLRAHSLKQVENFGDVQGIFWETKNNKVYAASDPRGEGAAETKTVNPTDKAAP